MHCDANKEATRAQIDTTIKKTPLKNREMASNSDLWSNTKPVGGAGVPPLRNTKILTLTE